MGGILETAVNVEFKLKFNPMWTGRVKFLSGVKQPEFKANNSPFVSVVKNTSNFVHCPVLLHDLALG
jgi:hypothetical protein